MEILPLHRERNDIRFQGRDATLCGWGAKTKNKQYPKNILNSNFSDDLHCTNINIYSKNICTPNIPPGDFGKNLLCGQEENLDANMPVVIKLYKLLFLFNSMKINLCGIIWYTQIVRCWYIFNKYTGRCWQSSDQDRSQK